MKKRGENVRRFRKIKAMALNLSIALIAVAALLTFDVGTSSQSGGGSPQVIHIETINDGGGAKSGKKKEVKVSSPDVIIEERVGPTTIIREKPGPTIYESVAPPPARDYYPPPSRSQWDPPSAPSAPSFAPTVLQQHPVGQPPNPPYSNPSYY